MQGCCSQRKLCSIDTSSESEPDETEAVGQGGLPSFSTPACFLQSTISTLSTEEDEGEELPPLKSAFHCQNIHTKIVNDGKEGWECGWCGKVFVPRHASRALCHVLKINKCDIAVCKAVITARYLSRYKALYDSGQGRMESKKQVSESIEESVASLQGVAVGTLLKKRRVAVSDCSGPLSSAVR